MAVPVIYVLFRRDRGRERWEVRREGNDRAISTHASREEACSAGNAIAKAEDADLVVHEESERRHGAESGLHAPRSDEVRFRTRVFRPGSTEEVMREFLTSEALDVTVGDSYVDEAAEGADSGARTYRVSAVSVTLQRDGDGRVLRTSSVYTEPRAPAPEDGTRRSP